MRTKRTKRTKRDNKRDDADRVFPELLNQAKRRFNLELNDGKHEEPGAKRDKI